MKFFNRDHIFTHRKRPHLGNTKFHFDFNITVKTIHFTSNEYFMPNSVYCIYRKGNKVKRLKSKADLLSLQDVSELEFDEVLHFKSTLYQDLAHKYLERYKVKDKTIVIRQSTQLPGEKIYIDVGYMMLPLHDYAMRESPFDTTISLYDPQNLARAEIDITVEHKERPRSAFAPRVQLPKPKPKPIPEQKTHIEMSQQRLEFLRRKSDLDKSGGNWTAAEQESLREIAPSEFARYESVNTMTSEDKMLRQESFFTTSTWDDPGSTRRNVTNSRTRYSSGSMGDTLIEGDEKEDDVPEMHTTYSREVSGSLVGFKMDDFEPSPPSSSRANDTRHKHGGAHHTGHKGREGSSDRAGSSSDKQRSVVDYENNQFPTSYQNKHGSMDEEDDDDDDKSDSVVAVSVTPSTGSAAVAVSKGYYNPNRSSRGRSNSHQSDGHAPGKGKGDAPTAPFSRAVTYKKISSPKDSRKITSRIGSRSNSSHGSAGEMHPYDGPPPAYDGPPPAYDGPPPAYSEQSRGKLELESSVPPPPTYSLAEPSPIPVAKLKNAVPFGSTVAADSPHSTANNSFIAHQPSTSGKSDHSDRSKGSKGSKKSKVSGHVSNTDSLHIEPSPHGLASGTNAPSNTPAVTPVHPGANIGPSAKSASGSSKATSALSARNQIITVSVNGHRPMKPLSPPQRMVTKAANGATPTAPFDRRFGRSQDTFDDRESVNSESTYGTLMTMNTIGTMSMAGSQAARRMVPIRAGANGASNPKYYSQSSGRPRSSGKSGGTLGNLHSKSRDRDGSPESQRSGRSHRSQRSQISNITGTSTATGRAKLMVPVRVPANRQPADVSSTSKHSKSSHNNHRSSRRSSNSHRGTALDRGSVAGQFPSKHGEGQFESGNPLPQAGKGRHSRTHSNASLQSFDITANHSQYDMNPGMTFVDNPANTTSGRDDVSVDGSVNSRRSKAYRYLPETSNDVHPEKLYAETRQNLGSRSRATTPVNQPHSSKSRHAPSSSSAARHGDHDDNQSIGRHPPPSPTPSTHSNASKQLTFGDYHRKKSDYELLQAEQFEAERAAQETDSIRQKENNPMSRTSRSAGGSSRHRPVSGEHHQDTRLRGVHSRVDSMDSMHSINSGISTITGTMMDDGDNHSAHHRHRRYHRVQVPNHR